MTHSEHLSPRAHGCRNLRRAILRTIVLGAFLSVLLPGGRVAAQDESDGLPEMVIPDGVGVNTHFVAGHTKDLDMIAAAGFKFIRQDLAWEKTERVKGEYDWTSYDSLMADVDRRGIRMLLTLSYNNSLYTTENLRWGPKDSANIAGYASWAGAAAKHFAGRHILWEIWNEPNTFTFWKPTPNANEYVAMALAACKAIRAADQHARIVAPALAGLARNFTGEVARHDLGLRGRFNWDFVKTLLGSGILPYLDGLSVHSYRDNPPEPPETVGSQYEQFSNLVAHYVPPGKTIPTISGEWGYTTCICNEGVLPQTQADWIARMQLFNLYSGIPLSIWYDWKNDGQDLSQKGQNRGLVDYNLSLKPSYVAMAVFTHQLAGYRISKRHDTGNPLDFVFVLTNSRGVVKVAAWTQGESHLVTFPLKAISMPASTQSVCWIDGNTETGEISVRAKSLTTPISGTPKYFSVDAPETLPRFDIPIPSVPRAIAPEPGATTVSRTPTIQWSASESTFPIRYQIQIATNPRLNTNGSFLHEYVVIDNTLVDTCLQLHLTLESKTTYSWHVRAETAGGQTGYSSTFSFKTGND
jgi:polysaccharide biosynthesis protein PslG